VCPDAFERGLLIETSGPHGEVAKVLSPLIVTDEELPRGLRLLEESVAAVADVARAGAAADLAWQRARA
jgi:diaminobutyrate-2-oxoglutarate transaminase